MTSVEIQELQEAAINGDVEFLKKCVESNKPIHFYTTFFSSEEGNLHHGNILHIAAEENSEDFIREVVAMLPLEDIQQLLLQPSDESHLRNPLHSAAKVGNVEIVRMFLNVFRSSSSTTDHSDDHSKRPWLCKESNGYNPFHAAISGDNEECALEIYKMDTKLLANMPSGRGSSALYEALFNKLTNLAMEIVRSPHSISCTGVDGDTLLHRLHYLNNPEQAKEFCQWLLPRDPELIKQKNNAGESALSVWVTDGKLWPFKCLLECNDIIPDAKRVFADLVIHTDSYGHNLLHDLAHFTSSEEDAIEIAKLLIGLYKQEASTQASIIADEQFPWLAQNNDGETPLFLAINRQYQKLAMYILSVDENAVIKSQENVLFLAIKKGCHEVAEKILEIVNRQGWTQILFNHQQSVVHLAPLCTENFCKKLMDGHPMSIKNVDKAGKTVLHSWIEKYEVWPFQFILKTKWSSYFVKLMDAKDYNHRNNPFHVAATTKYEAMDQIVQLLVAAYKEEFPAWDVYDIESLPWFIKNKQDEGPLHLAICNQRENLALYILSLHEDDHIDKLLDYYKPEHTILFLAVQYYCLRVAKEIMRRLDEESRTKYLKDSSNGKNILHLALTLTDEKLGKWLVNKAPPEFITEQDINGQSPWDKAYEVGTAWFIKAVLEKDPSVFNKAPLAWTKACEKGHVLALRAFIDHDPGAFRDLCIEHKDTPLHHIRLPNLTEYKKFLEIPGMKDLINFQDSKEETPLHKAIRKEDIYLTEILLNMDEIIYDINDCVNVTAADLLAREYNQKEAWRLMCKRIRFDPTIKTTIFQHTNLLDARNSLIVVAALLATITFTAGFTLPGGFNQDTGEALLAKKACFLVFLISDTLALFFSMLVLICLTLWSMVYDPMNSLIMIVRSMVLLRAALNCTLLAFMTGVYIVIAPKSLWVAILIIVIVSFLIVISFEKNVLKGVMDKVFPTVIEELKDPMHLIELGNKPYDTKEEQASLLSHNAQSSNRSSRSSSHPSNESSDEKSIATNEKGRLLSHHGESSKEASEAAKAKKDPDEEE